MEPPIGKFGKKGKEKGKDKNNWWSPKGKGKDQSKGKDKGKSKDGQKRNCYNCGKPGHLSKDCLPPPCANSGGGWTRRRGSTRTSTSTR